MTRGQSTRTSLRCPKCRRSMRHAKPVHWAFNDWLACPACDSYVKPSYYEENERG